MKRSKSSFSAKSKNKSAQPKKETKTEYKPHETACQIITLSIKRSTVQFCDNEAKNAGISRSFFANIYLEKGLNENPRWKEHKEKAEKAEKAEKESVEKES